MEQTLAGGSLRLHSHPCLRGETLGFPHCDLARRPTHLDKAADPEGTPTGYSS
jgi:hypothetical protein